MTLKFSPYIVSAVILTSLTACGGGSSSSSTGVAATGGSSNLAPVFSSSTSATLSENSTESFYVVEASDPDSSVAPTITLSSTADSAFFELDDLTLSVKPKQTLDFELPVDSDQDNVYDIVLTARDGDNASQSLTVAVTVTDVAENSSFGLNKDVAPVGKLRSFNMELQLPVSSSGNLSGTSTQASETELNAGYEDEYFFTGPDGAMVMRTPDNGATTSSGTRYTRTELREMLRAGNTSISTSGVNGNNWVLSTAPQGNQSAAGGVDGVLSVTMAVNEVVETAGQDFQKGRVVIGQIHGDDDEPIRLYYRKLPGNTHGSIYAAHEIFGGDDIYFEILGSRDNDATNPTDGILLDQIFTYTIEASGDDLNVSISRSGIEISQTLIDMSASGYENDWMYFKAGVYQLGSYADNTSGVDEFAQVSIYEISSSHD